MVNPQTQQTPTRQGQRQNREFQACIDACLACADACEMCAATCLGEQNVAELVRCIRLNQDCATFCVSAAVLMSRGSDYAQELCRLCAEVCDACGAECAKHQTSHCQMCAQACKSCADECRKMSGGASRQKVA